MKLKGISDKGISRIARVIKSQDLGEPDYGEGNIRKIKKDLRESRAIWTSEGWVTEIYLILDDDDLIRLPLIKSVGSSFNCSDNQLVSLEGSPKEVGGNFRCYNNQLVSLEGAPKEVGGTFWCSENQLISLLGAPEYTNKGFLCSDNQLTSLEGSPKEVGGDFTCYNNQLESLEGAPERVGGEFHCYNNSIEFTEEDIRSICNVEGEVVIQYISLREEFGL